MMDECVGDLPQPIMAMVGSRAGVVDSGILIF